MGFWIFGKKDNNEVKKLTENLRHSFLNIKEDIKSIHKYLSYFREKHDQHDEKHDLHSQRFDKLEEEIARIHEILVELKRRKFERSIVHERSRAFKRSNQSFMNVQSLKKLKDYLTPAQKRVIQLLSVAEIPLEYEDIARELKLSVITIRRHVNDIKRMGFQVREKMNIDTKRKVFYIEKGVKKVIIGKK